AVTQGALKVLLDRQAQAAAESRPGVDVLIPAGAGPRVRLALDVRNDVGRPMLLRLDDERTLVLLDLNGPGARRRPTPEGATPEPLAARLGPPDLPQAPGPVGRCREPSGTGPATPPLPRARGPVARAGAGEGSAPRPGPPLSARRRASVRHALPAEPFRRNP